jgi:hypothetical protein
MSSNPININNQNIFDKMFGGGKNDNFFTNYNFEIILFFNNREPLVINETTNDKYINLFSYVNKINFNDIKFYELNITFISFFINKYSIKNKFEVSNDNSNDINNLDYHTYKDEVIYLEITKNNNNYANCCIHIINDKSRLFFTPPNY